jgi:uncharacterized spore protein YtfJ
MAQGGGGFGGGQQMDPAQMLEMMKQRIKPQLMEKTKLSDSEADKVLEIQNTIQVFDDKGNNQLLNGFILKY